MNKMKCFRFFFPAFMARKYGYSLKVWLPLLILGIIIGIVGLIGTIRGMIVG